MWTAAAQIGGISESLSASPLLAMGLLFWAGVLTSLTPCVYPMIPITASVIAGASRDKAPRARIVGLTLTYVTGLAMFYALLGLLAGLSGTLFGTVSANPWVRFATANLLIIFALAMLDVIPVSAPKRLLHWAGGLGGGSYPAVFLLGATSGIVAAPCGAPAFAVVLTWVAATQAGAMGFIYLFVFSLGMTSLLVAVGLFSGSAAWLPKSGAWMVWIKKAGGYHYAGCGGILPDSNGTRDVNTVRRNLLAMVAVLGAIVMLFSGAAAQERGEIGIAVGETPVPPTIENLDGEPVNLADYVGEQPLLLEFWASWCEQCEALQPSMDAAYERYGEEVGFLAVAVAVAQSQRAVRRHLERHAIPFPMLWDTRGNATRAFLAPATAYVVILNAEGKVAYTGIGPQQDIVQAVGDVLAVGG